MDRGDVARLFVAYHSKYSIFSRHYQQYGLLRTRGLPHDNFALTDPPSGPYVSNPPLVPAVAVAADLAVARVSHRVTSPVRRGVLVVSLAVIALASAVYGNDRLRNLRGDASGAESRGSSSSSGLPSR